MTWEKWKRLSYENEVIIKSMMVKRLDGETYTVATAF